MPQNTFLTAIISSVTCLVIGFGSGVLWTMSDREKTNSAIADVEARAENAQTIAQQEIKTAKDETERLRGKQKSITIEFEKAKAEIVRLSNELKLTTAELKQTNDELAIEKSKNSQVPQQVTYIDLEKDTLKGLKGVRVVVESIRPEIEKYGLTAQQLQTDVELQLRQSGIRSLSEPERISKEGMPYFYVNVNFMIDEKSGLVSYNISLELTQNVFLAKDQTKLCSGTTWKNGAVGLTNINGIKAIREEVKGKVDLFINDYLAANPK